ncbi:MAG: nucleotidyltransferase domain-containing protein, partial [Candidatus Hodarchaeales archaeon]
MRKKLSNYPHLEELDTFIERISVSDPVLLLLFGSLTRGEYTQFSDIDVLCVYDREFHSHRERFMTSYQYSDGIVQPKTLSLSELKKGLLEGNSFLHHIFSGGYIIYSKLNDVLLAEW